MAAQILPQTIYKQTLISYQPLTQHTASLKDFDQAFIVLNAPCSCTY